MWLCARGPARVRRDDPSHLGRADQPNFLPFAIEPAGAAVICDQLRGQDFKYNDACIERHPAPQAAR